MGFKFHRNKYERMENKMKRIVSMMLVVLLTLSMMAGCGGKKENAPAQTTEPVQTTVPVQEDRPLSLGVVEGNRYTSEYAGLVCELPDDWTLMSAEEAQDLAGIVGEMYEGTELGDAIEDGQQFYDMVAMSGDMMTNMNIIIQKMSASERVAYMKLSEDEIAQMVLDQKDVLAEAYASAGMNLQTMEKVTVTYLGEEHSAIKTKMDVQGITCYQLQLYSYHLGEYAVTITLTSNESDNIDSMLEMFSAVE